MHAYLQLIRFYSPTGSVLLAGPALSGIALASGREIPWLLYGLFALGAFLMRSSGCIINDMIDRDLDAKVARTKDRPLASGAVSMGAAWLLLVILLLPAAAILYHLPLVTQIIGLAAIPMIALYPLMKRIHRFPQFFLAITFNLGVLMGWSAVREEISLPIMLFYLGCCCWTMIYDTIYGHQDKECDIIFGIKSSAISFGRYNKSYLSLFAAAMLVFFWSAGVLMHLGMFYYLVLALIILTIIAQITQAQFDNPEACMRIFKSNQLIAYALPLGILGSYWLF